MSNFIQKYQVLIGLIVVAIVSSITLLFLSQSSDQEHVEVINNVKIELSQNSNYLFSANFDPNNVTLYGVGIGDSVNKIKTEDISEKNDIWIHTINGAGYRPEGGKIVELVISSTLAKSFGILREEEIIIRFGNPDKINDSSSEPFGSKEYFYIEKGLIVRHIDKIGVSVNILGK